MRRPRKRNRGTSHEQDLHLATVFLTSSFSRPTDGGLSPATYRRLWEKFKAELCRPAMPREPLSLNCRPGERPWSFWCYDQRRVAPRPDFLQAFYLDARGLLSPAELEMIAAREQREQGWPRRASARPFERRFSWWKFDSPEPREFALPEGRQLIALQVLDDDERRRLAEDRLPSYIDVLWDPEAIPKDVQPYSYE